MDLHGLGLVLRERRESLGIAQKALAKRAGISPSYAWLVENAVPRSSGEPSRPSLEVLRRWAAILGLDEASVERLLVLAGYADEPAPRPRFASASSLGFPKPARADAVDDLVRELRDVLSLAEKVGKGEEVAHLARSYLRWLRYDIGQGQ